MSELYLSPNYYDGSSWNSVSNNLKPLSKGDLVFVALSGLACLVGWEVCVPLLLAALATGCSKDNSLDPYCEQDPSPKIEIDEWSPKPGGNDYTQEQLKQGIEFTWKPEISQECLDQSVVDCPRPVHGCDFDTKNIELRCQFDDGMVKATFDEKGVPSLTKMLSAPLTSKVMCDLWYTNSNKPGEWKRYAPTEAYLKSRISLFNIDPGQDIKCEKLEDRISSVTFGASYPDSSNVTIGDWVSYGIKVSYNSDCPAPAASFFLNVGLEDPYTMSYVTEKSDSHFSYYSVSLFAGNWGNPLTVSAQDVNAASFKDYPFYLPGSGFKSPKDPTIPLVNIKNIKYSYYLGEEASNVECYSNDLAATFKWTILNTCEIDARNCTPTVYYNGSTLPSQQFNLPGNINYECKATSTLGEKTSVGYAYWNVGVYTDPSNAPLAGMVANFSGNVGEPVKFEAILGPRSSQYIYTWEFPNGDTRDGTSVEYTFADAGTYIVKLAVEDTTTGAKSMVTQNITITPYSAPETLSIVAPPVATQNTSFNLKVGHPEAGFIYQWDFGDGNYTIGTDINHSYAQTGQFSIVLRATNENGDTFVSRPFSIYVAAPGVPLPPLGLVAPFAAKFGTPVSFTFPELDFDNYEYFISYAGETAAEISPAGGNPPILSYIYNSLGSYRSVLTAIAKNNANNIYQVSHDITITSYDTPYVGIQGPNNGQAGTSLSFFVPTPTPGATYTWLMGDNNTYPGTSVSHRYVSAGTYQIRLNADLNGSTNYTTYQVTVW